MLHEILEHSKLYAWHFSFSLKILPLSFSYSPTNEYDVPMWNCPFLPIAKPYSCVYTSEHMGFTMGVLTHAYLQRCKQTTIIKHDIKLAH